MKYESKNPLKRVLLKHFRRTLVRMLARASSESESTVSLILEAGAGEGLMTPAIQLGLLESEIVALDCSLRLLEQARQANPKAPVVASSVLQLPFADRAFDMTVCCEVLEHLDTPIEALRELCRVTSTWLLLSVPHEPWFRLGNLAGGTHLRTWGNPEDHKQHWSRKAFCTLLEPFMDVTALACPFPWIMALGRVEKGGLRGNREDEG